MRLAGAEVAAADGEPAHAQPAGGRTLLAIDPADVSGPSSVTPLWYKHWELTPADVVGDAMTVDGRGVLLVFVP